MTYRDCLEAAYSNLLWLGKHLVYTGFVFQKSIALFDFTFTRV